MISPIRKSASDVELLLNLTVVAPVHRILVASRLFAKKSRWHVLDGIEPKAIGTRFVDEPAHGTIEHAIDIFGNDIAHVVDAITMPPLSRLTPCDTGIDSGIGKRF